MFVNYMLESTCTYKHDDVEHNQCEQLIVAYSKCCVRQRKYRH